MKAVLKYFFAATLLAVIGCQGSGGGGAGGDTGGSTGDDTLPTGITSAGITLQSNGVFKGPQVTCGNGGCSGMTVLKYNIPAPAAVP